MLSALEPRDALTICFLLSFPYFGSAAAKTLSF